MTGPEDYTDDYDYEDWGETSPEEASEPGCYPLGSPSDIEDDQWLENN